MPSKNAGSFVVIVTMFLLLLSDDLDLPTNLLCVIFETNGAELSGKNVSADVYAEVHNLQSTLR